MSEQEKRIEVAWLALEDLIRETHLCGIYGLKIPDAHKVIKALVQAASNGELP